MQPNEERTFWRAEQCQHSAEDESDWIQGPKVAGGGLQQPVGTLVPLWD